MEKRHIKIGSICAFAFYLMVMTQPSSAQAPDISGKWILNVTTSQGIGKLTFDLKQEKDTVITGHYRGQFGEAPVVGTVKGSNFEFGYTIRDITVRYIGTFSKNSMEGKSIYGTIGEGTFTGKRKKK